VPRSASCPRCYLLHLQAAGTPINVNKVEAAPAVRQGEYNNTVVTRIGTDKMPLRSWLPGVMSGE
jgi:hypothetical protein